MKTEKDKLYLEKFSKEKADLVKNSKIFIN